MSTENITIVGDTFFQNGEEGVTINVENGNFVRLEYEDEKAVIKFLKDPEFSPCFFLTASKLSKLANRAIILPIVTKDQCSYYLEGCRHTFNPPEKGVLKSIWIEGVSGSNELYFYCNYE